jgi:hypothetical protein
MGIAHNVLLRSFYAAAAESLSLPSTIAATLLIHAMSNSLFLGPPFSHMGLKRKSGRWLRLGLEIPHDHLARKHPLKRLDRWCGPRLLFLLSRGTCDLCGCRRSRLLADLRGRRRLPFPRVARTRAGSSGGGDESGRPTSSSSVRARFRDRHSCVSSTGTRESLDSWHG